MRIERNFNIEENEMVKEISVKEFVDSGALWFINHQLHLFGMALTYDPDTYELTPAIVKFRGFSESLNDKGFKNLSNYLKDNISEIEKDCD
jgi:hypothetical protein